jgi:hypothetical protein
LRMGSFLEPCGSLAEDDLQKGTVNSRLWIGRRCR